MTTVIVLNAATIGWGLAVWGGTSGDPEKRVTATVTVQAPAVGDLLLERPSPSESPDPGRWGPGRTVTSRPGGYRLWLPRSGSLERRGPGVIEFVSRPHRLVVFVDPEEPAEVPVAYDKLVRGLDGRYDEIRIESVGATWVEGSPALHTTGTVAGAGRRGNHVPFAARVLPAAEGRRSITVIAATTDPAKTDLMEYIVMTLRPVAAAATTEASHGRKR